MTWFNRRKFLQAGGAGLAGVAFGGALGTGMATAAGALTVAWWGEGDQNKRTADALNAYAAKSGITVDAQGTNFNGYFDRLATQVAGGNPPDIFQVYLATMAEYAARGTIEPIDKYLGSTIDTSGWEQAALDSTSFNGSQFFVPLGLSNQPAIIYDKTLLDGVGIALKPDWTLAEFKDTCLAIAKALTAKNGKTAYGCDDLGGSIPVFEAFVRSKGKNVFAAEGGLGFTKDDLAEWYQFWSDGRGNGMVVPPEARKQGGFEASPIIIGTAPIVAAASTKGLQGYQSLSKNDLNFNPWPRYSADAERVELVTPIEWMVISASSSQKDEAAALLNFMVNDPASIAAMGIAHGVPVSSKLRKEIAASGKLSATEKKIYDATDAALPHSKPRVVFPPGSGPLVGPGTPLLTLLNQQITFKQIDLKGAVDRFFSEADRNLQ